MSLTQLMERRLTTKHGHVSGMELEKYGRNFGHFLPSPHRFTAFGIIASSTQGAREPQTVFTGIRTQNNEVLVFSESPLRS